MSTVTLADVRESFPIPGTYYLRFKRAFKKTWIWYDVTNPTEVVPSFEGSIVIKATRLPASAASKLNPSTKKQGSKVTPKRTATPPPAVDTASVKTAKSEPAPAPEDFFSSISPTTPASVPPKQSSSGDAFDPFASFS
ncbi:hypothetical protein WA588_001008, partial [Blastocystis sp. NMH]